MKTTALVLGVPEADVTQEQRRIGKAINLGLLYGMGAPRLQREAAAKYKVSLTAEDAGRYRAIYLQQYRGLHLWHRATGDRLKREKAIETRSLLGRRRLGVSRFNEALNAPIQALGADGFKLALALLFEHRHEVPTAKLILAVHDELVAECPAEDSTATEEWLRRHMEAGMTEAVTGKVPIQVDVTPGRDWAGTPIEE